MREPAPTAVMAGESFVAAVEAIYAAAAAPALWPDALQAIADCFGDRGAILIYMREDGSSGLISSPAIAIAAEEYNREWWRHDFRLARSKERGFLINGDAITDRDVVSEEEIAALPFYKEYLASHDLKWFAGTTISPDPGVWVGVSVQRAPSKAAYSDAELERVGLIGRHVENALRLGIRLLDAEVAAAALGDVLARMSVGVFLVDAGGRVVFSNPAADRLLGDALANSGGRLTARFAPDREALEVAIGEASGGERETAELNPRPLIVHGLQANDFLCIYVLPIRLPAGQAEQLLSSARAAVVVRPSNADEPADPALVRDLLGLTLGEARVASLVGFGLPPREAAGRLGISEETARTTLKRVFAKISVSRQSELAALLARLVLR